MCFTLEIITGLFYMKARHASKIKGISRMPTFGSGRSKAKLIIKNSNYRMYLFCVTFLIVPVP